MPASGLASDTELLVCSFIISLHIHDEAELPQTLGGQNATPYHSPPWLQYQWLAADLASVNRTETPWLIVTFHAPWYDRVLHVGRSASSRVPGHGMPPAPRAGRISAGSSASKFAVCQLPCALDRSFHSSRRYASYAGHWQEANCQRLAMEPLLYENGVDLVFNGEGWTSLLPRQIGVASWSVC